MYGVEDYRLAIQNLVQTSRGRQATVTRADGDKAAAILEAEGRLEASKRDAQAKVVLAEASQRAIQKITDAIKDLSKSQNSKVIVLPGDIPAAVRGIISVVGK